MLENDEKTKVDLSNIIKENKKIFSIFSGSRSSEIDVLTPILFKFIKMMKKKYSDIHFVFHTTNEHRQRLKEEVNKAGLEECDVISDEKIKSHVLKKSMFAVAKSGTISLEICNAKVPSVIIYKMNKVNFFIIKMLVKVKSPNIINIAADEEVIPELLQSKCNPRDIFRAVDRLLNDKKILEIQVKKSQEIINQFKNAKSSEMACSVLLDHL